MIAYWRFDEGKGDKVEDLSNKQNDAIIDNFDQSNDIWIMLEDGDPLELEDKWGKKCPV